MNCYGIARAGGAQRKDRHTRRLLLIQVHGSFAPFCKIRRGKALNRRSEWRYLCGIVQGNKVPVLCGVGREKQLRFEVHRRFLILVVNSRWAVHHRRIKTTTTIFIPDSTVANYRRFQTCSLRSVEDYNYKRVQKSSLKKTMQILFLHHVVNISTSKHQTHKLKKVTFQERGKC